VKRAARALVLGLGATLGGAISVAILQLPERAGRQIPVEAKLDASGVSHPVTAVLLNFRGYDTLLEIVVLLLALLGVLAIATGERSCGLLRGTPQPVLQWMARMLTPLMVLIAGYLLWAGAQRPGGAFQAGAVLAASCVLLYLARLMPVWPAPSALLRAGLAGGLLIFLGVAASLLVQGALLQYPPGLAGPLILLIEAALTLSLGLVLAGLFLWLPRENAEGGQ
jgi:multisubunit Na+/H+ antiporter MnhB subunit